MPFLAPLIPLVFTELTALPAELGTVLTPLIAPALTSMGLDSGLALSIANFASPEILGATIGDLAGGTKGLEEGLTAGLTFGGGGSALGQVLGDVGQGLGLSSGAAGTAGTALADLAPSGIQLGSMLTAPKSTPTAAPPVNTITPTPAAPALALPGGGGASGLNISGNTAPQVGPWVKNFWSGAGGSTPMVGTGGNQGPAPATGTSASATQQQQFVPSP